MQSDGEMEEYRAYRSLQNESHSLKLIMKYYSRVFFFEITAVAFSLFFGCARGGSFLLRWRFFLKKSNGCPHSEHDSELRGSLPDLGCWEGVQCVGPPDRRPGPYMAERAITNNLNHNNNLNHSGRVLSYKLISLYLNSIVISLNRDFSPAMPRISLVHARDVLNYYCKPDALH